MSLRRLQTDCIDLYQAHQWDPATPIEETLGAFDILVRSGKVRYIGVSNFTGWQLERTVLTARHMGVSAPVSLQPQYTTCLRARSSGKSCLCASRKASASCRGVHSLRDGFQASTRAR